MPLDFFDLEEDADDGRFRLLGVLDFDFEGLPLFLGVFVRRLASFALLRGSAAHAALTAASTSSFFA